MTAPWKEITLPTILAKYQLKDIFIANEFVLLYEALPSKSLLFRGKRFSGGKYSKVRLTGMDVSNSLGEKIPMFVIEKSASPRCFKHVRNLPGRYQSQKKAWLDWMLFDEWLLGLDSMIDMQERKFVITVDNYPAHSEVSGLNAINLQLLPPNTTSCTQPMSQGVIRRYVYFIIFLFY